MQHIQFNSMNRIRSIDGMRAISIIMVLIGHALHTMPSYISGSTLMKYIGNASLGVKIFFLISGYLITKLLIEEKKKTNSISIKKFYFRRAFRIFPVFYLYIIVIVVIKEYFIDDMFYSYNVVIFSSTYLWNYMHLFPLERITNDNGYWFFGHFWTLSMEEQFYLFWPITFKNLENPKLIKVVFIILMLMPVLRILTYLLMPASRGQIYMMLHTGGDTILTGCLGALLEKRIMSNPKFYKYLNTIWIILTLLVFLYVISPLLAEKLKSGYGFTVGSCLNNLSILILLFHCIYVDNTFTRILNSKLLIKIGILSYSLYVWQQLFLTDRIKLWVNHFPQNLIAVFVIALVSYNFVEKPILKLKERFK